DGCLALVGSYHIAVAQPAAPVARPALPALVNLTEDVRFETPSGFIDDVVASDADRIAYVISDATTKAELHVVTLAGRSDQVVDLAPITLQPTAIALAGQRALIVGVGEGGQKIGAIIELTAKSKTRPAGTVVAKIAPAANITVITRGGKQQIAVHRVTSKPGGDIHKLELLALDTGRKLATARPFEIDLNRFNKPLDFRVNHWSRGFTVAHGVKGGRWDKKEDQRSPDVEASYDLMSGKFIETRPIGDLYEQRTRFEVLAGTANDDFIRVDPMKGLQLWHDGKLRPLELDQPVGSYDLKTTLGVVLKDGSAWLALKIDPVNAEAVARQKADPEYLDVFKVDANSGKAVRKARVLATKTRFFFGIANDRLWLVERNAGFERGGKNLVVYSL
ncbi:MAG: hypothetical protein AB7P03_18025, partial [Kofleriaceae bacterium]